MRWAWPEDLAGFALDHLGLNHLGGRAEAMRVRDRRQPLA
jgi:hypothetical protein